VDYVHLRSDIDGNSIRRQTAAGVSIIFSAYQHYRRFL